MRVSFLTALGSCSSFPLCRGCRRPWGLSRAWSREGRGAQRNTGSLHPEPALRSRPAALGVVGGSLRPQKAEPCPMVTLMTPLGTGPVQCDGLCPRLLQGEGLPHMKAVAPKSCLPVFQIWTVHSHLVHPT